MSALGSHEQGLGTMVVAIPRITPRRPVDHRSRTLCNIDTDSELMRSSRRPEMQKRKTSGKGWRRWKLVSPENGAGTGPCM